ncbi:MAG: 3-hydroxyacyl-ACP dehydratase FabZ [Chlamydiae bacterium]|nr:3-hydroxyacyl-ACP dehydratase FabZ [Chlamydiota bacterium]
MGTSNSTITPGLGAHAIDIDEIIRILPHSYPFLLVDRILEIDLEHNRIIGQKNVTINEHFFSGHFPSKPIMPGVLIIESMAQVGGILMHKKGINGLKVLMSVYDARFRRPVTPGDVLIIDVQATFLSQRGGKCEAKAFVNNEIVVDAGISFGIHPEFRTQSRKDDHI